MARSRRRRGGGQRRSFSKGNIDWVYRGEAGDIGLGADTGLMGSYSPIIRSLTTGESGVIALILYDSVDRQQTLIQGGAAGGQFPVLGREARAQGKRPRVFRVNGEVYCEPSTWASGNLMAVGWRLAWFEQDTLTGQFTVQAEYSMWAPGTATPSDQPSTWADVPFLKEQRVFKGYGDGSSQHFMVIPINWKSSRGSRAPSPKHCLGIWMEAEGTSVNMRVQPWVRSLISDEG